MAARTSRVARPLRGLPVTFWKAITAEVSPDVERELWEKFVFALVGLWQAVTRELFFYAPNLAVSNANSDYFRVTSLFKDPSLYGRHLIIGMAVLVAE